MSFARGSFKPWPARSTRSASGQSEAESSSREALLAIVDALNAEGMEELVQRLREQAIGDSLFALERLIRHPLRAQQGQASTPPGPHTPGVATREGRPLTLGERKSLARRPDRDTMQRLLADPQPAVIQRCLRNPRITEDDVVRLAAKRPGRAEVLAVIARSTKWSHRTRVRLTLIMNPATPIEIAARISGLLLRPELQLVADSPAVPAAVRALCIEHLSRRPPTWSRRRIGRGPVH